MTFIAGLAISVYLQIKHEIDVNCDPSYIPALILFQWIFDWSLKLYKLHSPIYQNVICHICKTSYVKGTVYHFVGAF